MLCVALAVGGWLSFWRGAWVRVSACPDLFFSASTGSECSNMGRGELAESNLSLSSGNMREIQFQISACCVRCNLTAQPDYSRRRITPPTCRTCTCRIPHNSCRRVKGTGQRFVVRYCGGGKKGGQGAGTAEKSLFFSVTWARNYGDILVEISSTEFVPEG